MPTHSMNSTSDGTAPNGILDMGHLQKCVRITTLVEVEQYLMVALWTCGVSGRKPLGIVDAKTAIARNRRHVIPLVDEHLSSNVSTYVPSVQAACTPLAGRHHLVGLPSVPRGS